MLYDECVYISDDQGLSCPTRNISTKVDGINTFNLEDMPQGGYCSVTQPKVDLCSASELSSLPPLDPDLSNYPLADRQFPLSQCNDSCGNNSLKEV